MQTQSVAYPRSPPKLAPLSCSMLAIGTRPRAGRWLLTRDLIIATIAGSLAGYLIANLAYALWS